MTPREAMEAIITAAFLIAVACALCIVVSGCTSVTNIFYDDVTITPEILMEMNGGK